VDCKKTFVNFISLLHSVWFGCVVRFVAHHQIFSSHHSQSWCAPAPTPRKCLNLMPT
jgi:hypothetical protein